MAISQRFVQKYGGREAFFSVLRHSGTALAGGFSKYQELDWPQLSRLVFVCKGNICRSPFAAEKARLLGRHAVSAGLAAGAGHAADPRAQRAAGRRQVNLTMHRSQSVQDLSPQAGDLLVAFEPAQGQALRALTSGQSGVQVTLLGLWHARPWWAYLHDPYGLPDEYFDQCFERIEQSLEGLLNRWDSGRSLAAGGMPDP